MIPEIEFRDAGPDRQVAILGRVQLGEVVRLQAGGGRVRAWWRTYLPDDEVKSPVGAPTVDRACNDLIEHVEAWLRRLLPDPIRGAHGLADDPHVAALLRRFPGAEIVDVRLPVERSAAGAKVTMNTMRNAAIDEACRIEAVQAVLVADESRDQADAEQMFRQANFDALARLVDRCIASPVIMGELMRKSVGGGLDGDGG